MAKDTRGGKRRASASTGGLVRDDTGAVVGNKIYLKQPNGRAAEVDTSNAKQEQIDLFRDITAFSKKYGIYRYNTDDGNHEAYMKLVDKSISQGLVHKSNRNWQSARWELDKAIENGIDRANYIFRRKWKYA